MPSKNKTMRKCRRCGYVMLTLYGAQFGSWKRHIRTCTGDRPAAPPARAAA
jgi:hypothetical protein